MSIVLDLPIGRVRDPALPTLGLALDPFRIERLLRLHVAPALGAAELRLERLALIRHKPGRRALVEYCVAVDEMPMVLLGKLAAKGADHRAFETLAGFRARGFAEPSAVVVPEPIALLPEAGMLLMRRMPGVPFLSRTDRAAAVADALAKLQRALPVNRWVHCGADEFATLERELGYAARSQPGLARRVGRVLTAVESLARQLDDGPRAGLHRDFYHDQVLVDCERVVLLDLDCHAVGHPAIDAGNFIAHLLELELRGPGPPGVYATPAAAFRDCWLACTPGATRAEVERSVTLTLARHIGLSGRLPGRGHVQEELLSLVERRLGRDAA